MLQNQQKFAKISENVCKTLATRLCKKQQKVRNNRQKCMQKVGKMSVKNRQKCPRKNW
jgi:hypothetical protein